MSEVSLVRLGTYQIQLMQSLAELRQAVVNLRHYTLGTSIMGAMLSNPEWGSQHIKEKVSWGSGKIAEDIIETLEGLSP